MEEGLWEKETAKYRRRVASLELITDEVRAALESFPGLLRFVPTLASSVRHRSMIQANQSLNSAAAVLGSLKLLNEHGHFLVAAHSIRLLLEIWGSLIYLKDEVVGRLDTVERTEAADRRLVRLLLGTKSDAKLPAGITERFQVINVMEFIRAGEASSPGFNDRYDFLCDVSHPSMTHFYLVAFRWDGSWANPVFAEEAHRILEIIISTAESAVAGIRVAIQEVYRKSVPELAAEIAADDAKRTSEHAGDETGK